MSINDLIRRVLAAGGTLTLEPLSTRAGLRITAHRPGGPMPLTVSATIGRSLEEHPTFVADFAEQLEIQQFFHVPP